MSGALYIMSQNGMIDTGLMAVVFIVFAIAVIVGGVITLVDWVKALLRK